MGYIDLSNYNHGLYNVPLQNNLDIVSDPYIVGSLSGSLDAFTSALGQYSVARHVSYQVHKQTKACYILKSGVTACEFRIRCNIKKTRCALTLVVYYNGNG